jgi:hypothetical protein
MPGTRRPRVQEVVAGDHVRAQGEQEEAGAGSGASVPATVPRSLPPLPENRSSVSGILEEKTVVLYGPPGIGKSTMASEWAGGGFLFFDTAGELTDLEVYRVGVTDWRSFREFCASYAVDARSDRRFTGVVIDTADMLGTYCSQAVRQRLGIVHESDAEWGKGWSMVREEFASHVAKLAALPGGVILISHSKENEIKARNEVYTKNVPTLSGGIREACINSADLVLFIDYDADGGRVIYTKPGKYHEAKERSRHPRLPAEISWPIGESGWEVLKAAWYGGA